MVVKDHLSAMMNDLMNCKKSNKNETVVDLWFQSVCRNILMETYEQEAANRDNVRYINRKDLGDGKTEVS